ncbi:class I SAM-dependent methyltransferase [Streptomyces sp. NPDC059447]|uniref:class I SAM-dependent methyltransferase n=1 Tax=Streptomyces sp. NPDC059447 TaxID=3346834 RepID=UPI0036A5FAF3
MTTPFASAAAYPDRHGTPYPAQLHALLADRFVLDGSQTALELGARGADAGPGPGVLALSLTPSVDHVYAVHPDPEVLAEGSRLAEERGCPNVSWLEGDASAITRLCLPRIDLCVIGGAFDEMDGERVLADLDTVLAPRGGVAVITSPDRLEDLTDVLAKSVFSRVETTSWEQPAGLTAVVATRPRL